MLRSSAQSLSRGVARIACRPSAATRNMSGPAGKSSGGGGKVILATGLATVGVLGGTLGYAAVDKDFRKWVEESVPGSSGVFAGVLGEPEAEKPKRLPPARPPMTSLPASKKRSLPEPPATATLPNPVPSKSVTEQQSGKEEKIVVLPPPPPLDEPSTVVVEKEQAKMDKSETIPTEVKIDKPTSKPETDKTSKTNNVENELLLSTEDLVDLHDNSNFLQAEKDLHRRVAEIRDELELQMVKQLKRQAEAHSDHIHDALDVQKKELTRKFMRELDEALEQATLTHRDELTALAGHVRALDESLRRRSTMEVASLEAQELWLACTAVVDAVESSCSELQSLSGELAAVRKVPSDDFVRAVLDAVPEEAAARGIYTETSIRERFLRVERLARRTAMIGEEGGSLFKYFLSYLQSLLILKAYSTEGLPGKDAAVDVDSLNTYDLVWLARGCLDRGDLDQAVRYMTLLKGEPRNVAKDWLREARLLLETRQACRALMAHAAAVSVEALPQRK